MNGKFLKVTFKLLENVTLEFEDTKSVNYATNALVQYQNSRNKDLLITVPSNDGTLLMFYPHSVVSVEVEDVEELLTYVDNGSVAEEMPTSHSIIMGHKLTALDLPTLTAEIEELTFDGWYNEDGTVKYNVGDRIYSPTTLYAIFKPSIKMIYKDEDEYGKEVPNDRIVPFKHYLAQKDLPVVESKYGTKLFLGWFNQAGTTKYNVGDLLESNDDVTLYAKFINKEEISIYYYARVEGAEIKHLYDKTWYKNYPITSDILAPFEPYYDEDGNKHSFVRWENSSGDPYNVGDVLTENVSMYTDETIEEPTKVNISYLDEMFENEIEPKKIAVGLPIDDSYLPTLPDDTKDNVEYTFDGWYSDGGVKYVSGSMFDTDTVFYAKWIEKE